MPSIVPIAAGVFAVLVLLALFNRWSRGLARQTVLRFRARLDRYKLVDRREVRSELLADPVIRAAMERHAVEHGVDLEAVRDRVRGYVDEIVPFFKILSYYKVAYTFSRSLSRLFYRVSVEYEDEAGLRRLPRRDVVVYLVNHRSNMDYVLLVYVLAGVVSLSWAVGEWARTWPLEYVFKTCGGYFVRRRFPEPLYHTVLARYVQLITRHRVTQGVFPEGGLSRDGTLRPPKLGILDAVVRTIRDPAFDGDVWLVPVAVNYDRVLEDRALTRELLVGTPPPSRAVQLGAVITFLGRNLLALVLGQRRRYGWAAVTIGAPVSVRGRFAGAEAEVLDRVREERLGAVAALADTMMRRIGALVPVTPVPLAAAAVLSFPGSLVAQADLPERLDELRDGLRATGARIVNSELTAAQVWERAWRIFHQRRWLIRSGESVVVLPGARPLLEYYANSIRHLVPVDRRWELTPAGGDDPSLPRLARA